MKKKIHIIAVVLVILLLSVALVACGDPNVDYSIKGTTDITVNFDQVYNDIRVECSSATVTKVTDTQYKITKNNTNITDVIISSENYNNVYLSYKSSELKRPIVENITLSSTDYTVSLKFNNMNATIAENVKISLDGKSTDFVYDEKSKLLNFVSKLKYSDVKITLDGYVLNYNELIYKNANAVLNVNALKIIDGYAHIIVKNHTDRNISYSFMLMTALDQDNRYLKSGESALITVPIDNYVLSQDYYYSRKLYRSDLEDGVETVELEVPESQDNQFVLDKLVDSDSFSSLYIDGHYVSKEIINVGEFEGKELYIINKNFKVGEQVVVKFERNNKTPIYFEYTVTQSDVDTKTLAIEYKETTNTPVKEFTFRYVDVDGELITDDAKLRGLEMMYKNQSQSLEIVNGVATYINNNERVLFDYKLYNEYYLFTNPDRLILVDGYMATGKDSIDIVLDELETISVKFVYDDIDGVRKDYDGGLNYNKVNGLTVSSDFEYANPVFINNSTLEYTISKYSHYDIRITLLDDFDSVIGDVYNDRNTLLPGNIKGLVYDEVSDTYQLELVVYKYYDLSLSFNYTHLSFDAYSGHIRFDIKGRNYYFGSQDLMGTCAIRVNASVIGDDLVFRYNDNNNNYSENTGRLTITKEMLLGQVAGDPPVNVDIKIIENDKNEGGGGDDF